VNTARILLYVCLLSIASVVGSILHGMLSQEVAYLMRGETTKAHVIGKSVESHSSPGRQTSKGYYVTYEYVVDGETYQNKDMLDIGRGYDALEEGQVLDVVYDPTFPDVARTKLSRPLFRYSLITLFIFAMAGLVAFVPYYFLRRASFAHALKGETVEGEATITHPISSNVNINNKNAFRVRYAFRDQRGVRRDRKTVFIYSDDVRGYQKGDTVTVRYNKSNSKLSAIELEFKTLGLAS